MDFKLFRIGTCSWKYPSWKGLVYSQAKPGNYLQEYARKYNTVEIDQWFWSLHPGDKIALPRADVVTGYEKSVPDDFTFSVKVPNSLTLTHPYSDPKTINAHFLSNDLFNTFLETLEPMAKKLGPLIFQFEYLNKQKMPHQGAFQEKLAAFFSKAPAGYDYAIEVRNPNYLNKAFFDFLKAHKLSYVFTDGYYMPPLTEVYPKAFERINAPVFLRLLGANRKDIETQSNKVWNQRLTPRDESLIAISEMIRELLAKKIPVTINVNNHYEGSAPLTIERLMQLLQPDR